MLLIERCKKCKRFRVKEWTEHTSLLKEQIERLLKGQFERAEVVFFNSKCRVDFILREMKISREIPIKEKMTLCDVCAAVARGYYEAIIQLRGTKERASKIAEKVVQALEKKTFISAMKEFPYGVDMYVGSTNAVWTVLGTLKLRPKITKKLHSTKAGKKLFRTTFLVEC